MAQQPEKALMKISAHSDLSPSLELSTPTESRHERFLWLLRHTEEPQRGETAVYGYNPA